MAEHIKNNLKKERIESNLPADNIKIYFFIRELNEIKNNPENEIQLELLKKNILRFFSEKDNTLSQNIFNQKKDKKISFSTENWKILFFLAIKDLDQIKQSVESAKKNQANISENNLADALSYGLINEFYQLKKSMEIPQILNQKSSASELIYFLFDCILLNNPEINNFFLRPVKLDTIILERNLKIMKIVIIIMTLLVALIFLMLIIRRKRSEKNQRMKKILNEKYIEIINNYLYENNNINEAVEKIGVVNFPIYLMTIDNILNLVKGEFEDKIIELSAKLNVYQFLLNESNDKHWWKKVKAVYHLGKLKYYDGLENNFFENAIKDKSEDVRAATIVALSYIPNEQSLKLIIDSLFDNSSIVSEKAKETLIKFGKKSYNKLIENLENEKLEKNIISILHLLSIIKDDNFISKINTYLENQNEKIIAAALNIAGALEYPIDITLIKKYLNSNNYILQYSVLKNIYNIADESIIEEITKFLVHKDWDLRYLSAAGLYKLGPKGRDTLNSIVQNSNDKYAVDMVKMVIDEQRMG